MAEQKRLADEIDEVLQDAERLLGMDERESASAEEMDSIYARIEAARKRLAGSPGDLCSGQQRVGDISPRTAGYHLGFIPETTAIYGESAYFDTEAELREHITGHPPWWSDPDWQACEKVHDWRNYISDELRSLWSTFTDEQKAVIAENAQRIADREDWD